MKTVILVRHAKSNWDNPMLRDIERPLNDTGFKTAEKMAVFFHDLKINPDKIISSPAVRAHTTATIFAKVLNIPESEIQINKKIYEALMTDILEIIHELPNDINTVMVFGHNPTFTNLANYFSSDFIPNVSTCGIAVIHADTDTWSAFDNHNAQCKALYFPKEVL